MIISKIFNILIFKKNYHLSLKFRVINNQTNNNILNFKF